MTHPNPFLSTQKNNEKEYGNQTVLHHSQSVGGDIDCKYFKNFKNHIDDYYKGMMFLSDQSTSNRLCNIGSVSVKNNRLRLMHFLQLQCTVTSYPQPVLTHLCSNLTEDTAAGFRPMQKHNFKHLGVHSSASFTLWCDQFA